MLLSGQRAAVARASPRASGDVLFWLCLTNNMSRRFARSPLVGQPNSLFTLSHFGRVLTAVAVPFRIENGCFVLTRKGTNHGRFGLWFFVLENLSIEWALHSFAFSGCLTSRITLSCDSRWPCSAEQSRGVGGFSRRAVASAARKGCDCVGSSWCCCVSQQVPDGILSLHSFLP